MAASPTIWTIGYERASSDALLAALKEAGVQVLMDVRDLPLSRRAGFSKSTLRASLEAAGIELGRDYPTPVVQHDAARARTLERYAMAKGVAAKSI